MTATYDLVCDYCDAADGPDCTCRPVPHRRVRYREGSNALPPPPTAIDDLWRYQDLLPIRRDFGSWLSVGGTPLLDLGVTAAGVRLFVKDESRNPSGSLKDRASEVALAMACSEGHDEVITASTGNAGASMACIAAARGLRARVVVPRSAPSAKLAQIVAYGAVLVPVDGNYDDAYDLALRISEQEGIYCRNTGFNPFCREGKKTVAFEIAEQLSWNPPDWVVVPTGDGNILSAVGTGFAQLERVGWTSRSPRLVAAQAASSDSIRRTYQAALRTKSVPREPVPVNPHTVADSIAVARPRDHVGAIRALLRTDGIAEAVGEAQIRAATETLARRYGLWAEPSAGAAYAALDSLCATGEIQPEQSVVLLLTGSGLKDPRPWDD